MAKIANARKVFNFVVEIDGIDQFTVQKVTLPEITVEQVEHGDTNHMIKTAGMVSIGNMTFEKLKRMPGSDTDAWDWLRLAQSQVLGGGVLSEAYKRVLVIKEMDSTGLITLNRHICTGCWVTKVSQNDLDRTSSDNVMQTVELSVDVYEQI